jgi:glycogen operon protein
MGDEVRRSQGGNNNSWCQNNPLGWMHWQADQDDGALRAFLQRLITLRSNLAGLLNPELAHPEQGASQGADGPELWRQWHGVELNKPDWASWSHTLAWTLNHRSQGPLLWCGMNAYGKAIHFDLPICPSGWLRAIDTGLAAGEDLPTEPGPWRAPRATLESRSVMLLVAKPLLDGVRLSP